MTSGTPIVRQISWLAVLPQAASCLVAIGLVALVNPRDAPLWGGFAYLTYSISSRIWIAAAHRSGIRLVKKQRFEDAILKFQESFDFFERHRWIDRFRAVTLMSPSAISYREMALANIAFCYGQTGNGEQCRAYYQKCLELFPGSGLAKAGLRMMNAASASM